jgi:phosphatidylglycerophosphate synthase
MKNVKTYTKAEENLVKLNHKFKDVIFKPIIIALTYLGVPPNFIASLSAVIIVAALYFSFILSNPYIYLIGLWAHFVLDALDGPLARFQGKNNNQGAITDSLVDYLGVLCTTIFIGLFTQTPVYVLLLFATLYLMEIYNTFISSILNSQLQYGTRPRVLVYFLITLEMLTNYAYTNTVLGIVVLLMIPMVIVSFINIYKLAK